MLPVLGSVRSGLRGTDVAAVTQHTVFVPAEILYIGMSNVKMKGGSCMSHATSNIPTPHPHLSQTVAQTLGCLVWDIAAHDKKKKAMSARYILTPGDRSSQGSFPEESRNTMPVQQF